MQSQDVVILLKLVSLQNEQHDPDQLIGTAPGEDPASVRNLEAALGISKTEISASLNRSLSSGLAIKDRRSGRPRPRRRNLYNLIVHGLKFIFPPNLGPVQRGLSTAFSAPMLENNLLSAGEYSYVWPYARGQSAGISVTPLYKSVPDAIQRDVRLYKYLALVDAIRIGNQREMGVASELLSEDLLRK